MICWLLSIIKNDFNDASLIPHLVDTLEKTDQQFTLPELQGAFKTVKLKSS